jgi:hypothetical protein
MRLTTILLLFLLLLLVGLASAQVTIEEIKGNRVSGQITLKEIKDLRTLTTKDLRTLTTSVQNNNLTSLTIGTCSYPNLIDTIKSELLISLTIPGKKELYKLTCVMIGYEVIKRNMPSIYPESTIEWFYLDDNKKPLNKNINVWMSKPIKP